MWHKITRPLRRVARKVIPRKQYVELDGSILPAAAWRWCGRSFKNDHYYLRSAEHEAQRLVERFGCSLTTRVLDIGCGPGRLAIGLLRVVGELDYTGIDVNQRSIAWCQRYIAREHPSFKFHLLDVYNERYNPKGRKMDENFRFDLPTQGADIIYLYSVFSHMPEADMLVYLREFRRLLAPGGGVFFTTFVEQDVPDVTINPENYRLQCSGPLHIVRYRQEHLFSILEENGYVIEEFTYETETDGQSAFYLRLAEE